MDGATITDVIALALVVGMVYVIVRPNSKAAALVDAITKLTVGIVHTATQG